MKQKKLEILLQKVPDFNSPTPHLEQYLTPANIAADIVFTASQYNDVENKIVVDLGCGTGIFAYGAYLCGAAKVIGFDIDKTCIQQARNYAFDEDIDINYLIEEIKNISIVCDTVIMNPPFGAQKSNINADREFIKKGFEISNVIYSLHLTKTIPFIEKLINALGGKITYSKNYEFPIKHIHKFHKKEKKNFDITLLRIHTKSN